MSKCFSNASWVTWDQVLSEVKVWVVKESGKNKQTNKWKTKPKGKIEGRGPEHRLSVGPQWSWFWRIHPSQSLFSLTSVVFNSPHFPETILLFLGNCSFFPVNSKTSPSLGPALTSHPVVWGISPLVFFFTNVCTLSGNFYMPLSLKNNVYRGGSEKWS